MKLQKWLKSQPRGTLSRLARFVGVKIPSAHKWVTEKSCPKLAHCERISLFTQGKVTYKDFM
nr:MAG TPA: repressor protein [Caudoviricetes sp.]